jgi:hypothetical protein
MFCGVKPCRKHGQQFVRSSNFDQLSKASVQVAHQVTRSKLEYTPVVTPLGLHFNTLSLTADRLKKKLHST